MTSSTVAFVAGGPGVGLGVAGAVVLTAFGAELHAAATSEPAAAPKNVRRFIATASRHTDARSERTVSRHG